jgi:hypothetical protein
MSGNMWDGADSSNLMDITETRMLDIAEPEHVGVEIREDGKVLWVHVNGVTVLRICRISHLQIINYHNSDEES